jgi:hypothetical protein
MNMLEAYIKTCNYNPLSMISPLTGGIACQPIDTILDKNFSAEGIYFGITSAILWPIAYSLMGLEIGIDSLFRKEIGHKKIENLRKLSRLHDTPTDVRMYDLLWSIQAEASQHPYGEEVVFLYSLDKILKDDYRDFFQDRFQNNFFRMPESSALSRLEELGTKKILDKLKSVSLSELEKSPPYRVFGIRDPFNRYEELKEKLVAKYGKQA